MRNYAESHARLFLPDLPVPSRGPDLRGLIQRWELLHWRFLMLRWALGLLIASMVAGFVAFVGVPSPVEAVARILFFAFLASFLVALVGGLIGGRGRKE